LKTYFSPMLGSQFYAPFIVMGMHRSGTSLVAQILNDAGICMGVLRDHNAESLPFLSANILMLQNNQADWLQPVPIKTQPPFSAESMVAAHFQLPNQARWRLWLATLQPWGFKDPRNIFTIQAWQKIFPKAKVIHVVRDREAVVKSLLVRQNRVGEQDSQLDAEAAQNLWAQYVEEARKSASDNASFIEVAYEDLIAFHSPTIQELSKFCNRNLMPHVQVRVQEKTNI